MNVLGIDPGLGGAVALLRSDGTIRVWDVPTIQVTRGKVKGKDRIVRELNEDDFASIIDFALDYVDSVWIEKVASMADQGVASQFAFGQVYGAMRMAIAYAGHKYNLVTPQKWKLAMGCGASKDSSLYQCLKRFPGYDHLWIGSRGGTLDGRCEAALIAAYGSTQKG